jgi:WD40 repeat protein
MPLKSSLLTGLVTLTTAFAGARHAAPPDEAVLTFAGHAGHVNCVTFSPDGKFLISGGDDKVVRVWDATTGKERRVLKHEDTVYAVAFGPDGKRLASASWDKTVKVWQLDR